MQTDSDGPQTVSIQLNGATIRTVRPQTRTGYFDAHLKLTTSGSVRLAYTYPATDPFLPIGVADSTVYSRTVTIRAR